MQKQVVIKQKSKLHREACYLAFKVGLNSTSKERHYNKEFVKNFLFVNIDKLGFLLRSRRVEKN